MQNRSVTTLGMALAGLVLLATWALAAEEAAGAVVAQLSSVDLHKGTITLRVDNTRPAGGRPAGQRCGAPCGP